MARLVAPKAYQRDDDRDQHAVLPCRRRAVAAASVKSSYMTGTSIRRPHDCFDNVEGERGP